MFGLLGAIGARRALAVAVAFMLSPLAPIGPAHQIDPSPGFAADWTVLATGLAVLIVVLGVLTAVRRTAPSRARSRPALRAHRAGSSVVNAAARSGLRPRLLRDSASRWNGDGRSLCRCALPWSVRCWGGRGGDDPHLRQWAHTPRIASRPLRVELGLRHRRCGREWLCPARGAHLLPRDPDVAALTGYNFAGIEIDGQTIPVLLAQKHAEAQPAHPVRPPSRRQ